MKRVVFLLVLLSWFVPRQVEASVSNIYAFTDYQIRTTETVIDGARGYEIDKVGRNPFSRTLTYPETLIHINDIVEVNGNHVLYGYLHDEEGDSYYDGFLTVLSPTGEEITHMVFDNDEEEDILLVVDMGDMMFVVIQELTMNEREQYDFLRLQVLGLDYNFSVMDEREVYQEPEQMVSMNGLLLLNFDYDDTFDLGITRTLDIIQDTDPLPIETDQTFLGTVSIPFLNEALLNGMVVEHGITIDYPGNYVLEYNEFTYEFTVLPEVSGIDDGGVYNDTVTPVVSGGKLTLNDDSFVSGTPIAEPGDYTLVVEGKYGLRITYQFTITSNLQGIHHNGRYTDTVELSFLGIGYLNNGFITSPYQLEEPGEYILTIEGNNAYKETYFFTIETPEEERTFIDFLRQYDLAILGITVLGGLLVLKKK